MPVVFLFRYFIRFLYALLLVWGMWSCRSADDWVHRYRMYDKAQSRLHLQINYHLQTDGSALFFVEPISTSFSPLGLDSVEVSITLCQDSLRCLPLLRSRLSLDSLGKASIRIDSLDSNKPIFADIFFHSQVVKQHSSFFIHQHNTRKNGIAYPQLAVMSADSATQNVYYKQILDTLPAQPPFAKAVSTPPYVQHFTFAGDTLGCQVLYSNEADTSLSAQTFYPALCHSDFPQFVSVRAIYHPLQYLVPDLPRYENDSLARIYYELFWYKAAKRDFANAREMMRIYYNRAQLANEFFTSYKEGWKTDRGMVLMVLGLADDIRADFNGETWVYYNTDGEDDVQFRFSRVIDSPVSNDLRLQRDGVYEIIWRTAIENWRKGAVFARYN